jgi:hypothetical protein
VNFAFAYIDPATYQIATMESDMPTSLFVEAADIKTLKSGTEDVEIFVSIGGWSFSDNFTATQPVFSDIAASEANRNTFANNLVNFLKEYGFDGGKCLAELLLLQPSTISVLSLRSKLQRFQSLGVARIFSDPLFLNACLRWSKCSAQPSFTKEL